MGEAKPMKYSALEAHEIAKQAEVELALLENIRGALQIALEWRTGDHGHVRKLSTLRFVTRSFERHLTRLRMLAEYGGYMHLITEAKPHLANEVAQLRKRRDKLQATLDAIIMRLDHIQPSDGAAFNGLCTELERFLDDLKLHSQKEMELRQHSFAQEEGGSG